MNILDSVIKTTNEKSQSGWSSNHDLTKIKVDMPTTERPDFQAQADRLASWDSYEMGISAAELQRQWERANTPEAREKLRQDLMRRAQQRANLFQRSDGVIAVMVAHEPAWHELGYTMYAEFTGEQIKEICLNWQYELVDMTYPDGTKANNVQGIMLVENDGTRRGLPGVAVSDSYHLVQPAEFIDWSAQIIDSVEGAKFCAAGSVDDGKRIWTQARLPEVFEPIRGDVTEHYLLTTDVFNGKGTQRVITTAERVVCQNTMRLADSHGSRHFTSRHTKNMSERMKNYASGVQGMRRHWNDFRAAGELMVNRDSDTKEFAKPILDMAIGVTDCQRKIDELRKQETVNADEVEAQEALLRKREVRVEGILDTILEITESETNTAKGKLWGDFQSVTEYANHRMKTNYRADTNKSRAQFESVMLQGKADQISQLAFERAVEMVVA